jgi:ankyrin repeat protein
MNPKFGETALICAVNRRQTATVQVLLDAGDDKDTEDNVSERE